MCTYLRLEISTAILLNLFPAVLGTFYRQEEPNEVERHNESPDLLTSSIIITLLFHSASIRYVMSGLALIRRRQFATDGFYDRHEDYVVLYINTDEFMTASD